MLWDTDETLSELFIDGEIRVFLPFSGRFLINSVEFTKIFRFSREFVEISWELNRLGTFVKNEAIAAFLDPYFHESGLKRLTIKSYGLSKLHHAEFQRCFIVCMKNGKNYWRHLESTKKAIGNGLCLKPYMKELFSKVG